MMKKFFHLVLLFTLLVSSPVTLTVAAQSPNDPPPNPVFLPLLLRASPTHAVTGQVTDMQANPLAGAAVTDNAGHVAYTDANGNYFLRVSEGDVALAPSLNGYQFSPSMVEVDVSSDITNQDFTAALACNEATYNGGFEISTWWNLLEVDYPSSYSPVIYHTGSRSLRTGIVDAWDNRYGYSSVRSPLLIMPSGVGSITLSLWIYPLSTEATSAPSAPQPDGPAFGDTAMTYDAQYVQVLDSANNILETLMWIRSNNAYWTYHTFDLTRWAGRSIKLNFGSYNDGAQGITAMYLDDVSLQICDGGSLPPTEPQAEGSCGNQVSNSSFEYNGSWGIPATPYPAAYSTDYAYHGSRSMRTGIPLYASANRYSYSDAWQTVYIPASASSATLHLRLYPRHQGSSAPDASAEDALPQAPLAGAEWTYEPLASDVQYLLILNPHTGAIIDTLFWDRVNASGWLYREFNINRYIGRSIRIQFGTYNNGTGGRTVMYVDKLQVDTCDGAPPPPPPPPLCSERIANRSFESNSAWYIPLTAFSAGYSTHRARTGARSMRSGIVYWYHNRYSYSDFGQVVSIPASSSSALLSMYLYPSSGESYAPIPERPTSPEFGAEAMAGDVQYLLVLDRWGNWLDTLIWRRGDERYWMYAQFNLLRFAGQTIRLQWGVYNNGYSGVTSMYVDDVSLVACP